MLKRELLKSVKDTIKVDLEEEKRGKEIGEEGTI